MGSMANVCCIQHKLSWHYFLGCKLQKSKDALSLCPSMMGTGSGPKSILSRRIVE
jgi:hypothetical protein